MEGTMWDHFWHIRTTYYTVKEQSDYVFDFPSSKNTRDDASVVIKPIRLRKMVTLLICFLFALKLRSHDQIDAALEDMS